MSAEYRPEVAPCPRSLEELRAKLAEYSAPGAGDRQYVAGVQESLRWVMGQRPTAPVTGVTLSRRPTEQDIAEEADAAENAMRAGSPRGQELHQRHGLGYLTGCENALFWAAALDGPDSMLGI